MQYLLNNIEAFMLQNTYNYITEFSLNTFLLIITYVAMNAMNTIKMCRLSAVQYIGAVSHLITHCRLQLTSQADKT